MLDGRHFRFSFLKNHYALAPLYVSVGFGLGFSVIYTVRLAIQNPDVSWRRTSNPEPWQRRVDGEGKTKRYKVWQAPGDGSAKRGITQYGTEAFAPERPPIEKMWSEYQSEHAAEAHH